MKLSFGYVRRLAACGLLAGVSFWSALAEAQIPRKFSYQGILSTAAGQPVNATLSMQFNLYDIVGGPALHTETQNVTVTNGVFSVLLGTAASLTLPFDVPYNLGVKVGDDSEMTPRQTVAAVPYALGAEMAIDATQLGGHPLADFILAGAAIPGSQITGSLSTATLPSTQITGTILGTQIANGAITLPRLAATNALPNQYLATPDGATLQWAPAGSVSSVSATAGGGLATTPAGGISSTGSVRIATGGIQGTMLADGAVTAAKLAQNGCAFEQVLKWNGNAWACANDLSGGSITAVTASAPLAASGGFAPDISLTGTVPVGNGGTGRTSIPTNAIIFGQGSTPVAYTLGDLGQVLTGSAGQGPPTWSGSPMLSGSLSVGTDLVLPATTAAAGRVMQGGKPLLHTYGNDNTYVGKESGSSSETGFGFNTAVGRSALSGTTSGAYNSALGKDALKFNTEGASNTAVGESAMWLNATGDLNTAVGSSALSFNTSGNGNTAVGWSAMYGGGGTENTAVGVEALRQNSGGSYNTVSGTRSFRQNSTGYENVAVGYQAGYSNTTGYSNAIVGSNAFYFNNGGAENAVVGANALRSNAAGVRNSVLGFRGMYSNLSGNYNVAVGGDALYTTTGSSNTAVGMNALHDSSSGSNNTALGNGAGSSITTGSNNIMIGNAGGAGDANMLRIGTDGTQTSTFIAAISGKTSSSGVTVFVNAAGQLGTTTSSARFKDNIRDMDESSARLLHLRPVTFTYKPEYDDHSRVRQYGLVAEEVAQVYPELVTRDRDGQIESVRYHFLTPMLLNEMQKLERVIAAQATHIRQQETVLTALQRRLAAIEDRLASR